VKAALMLAAALAVPAAAQAYVPVVTPNGSTLPYKLDTGQGLPPRAEQVKREIAPGMVINAWGYTARHPGPPSRPWKATASASSSQSPAEDTSSTGMAFCSNGWTA